MVDNRLLVCDNSITLLPVLSRDRGRLMPTVNFIIFNSVQANYTGLLQLKRRYKLMIEKG